MDINELSSVSQDFAAAQRVFEAAKRERDLAIHSAFQSGLSSTKIGQIMGISHVAALKIRDTIERDFQQQNWDVQDDFNARSFELEQQMANPTIGLVPGQSVQVGKSKTLYVVKDLWLSTCGDQMVSVTNPATGSNKSYSVSSVSPVL